MRSSVTGYYSAYCIKDRTLMNNDHYEVPHGDTTALRACYSCDTCGNIVDAPVQKWAELTWQ